MELGTSRIVDKAEALSNAVESARRRDIAVLSFGAFSRLLESRQPTPSAAQLPAAIACMDSVLTMSDAQIRRNESSLFEPSEIRRLRRAYLLSAHNKSLTAQQQHEIQVLNAFPHGENVTLLDYENYIAGFFKPALAAFFSERAFCLPIDALKKHAYVSACSGHGKSELVKQLVHGVMKSGHSAIVLDPHGKLATEIAHWREFAEDPERLVYFQPSAMGHDLACPPVINPLASLRNPADRDATVEGIIAGITAVVGRENDLSNRMHTVLLPCLHTMADYTRETTLYDLLDFLGNGERADYWKAQARQILKNQAMLATIDDFDSNNYKNTKSGIVDRVRVLLGSNALDACLIGNSTIDLERAMDSGKIIVFNLSTGPQTSGAFGRFIISALATIAMQRPVGFGGEKRPAFLFLDEADRFMTPSIEVIYKETRKYGLYLTLVQQIAGYGLSGDTMKAISGNSGACFTGNTASSKECARVMSEMTETKVEDIKSLAPLNFWMKIGNAPAQKFKLGGNLLGQRNSMSEEEWTGVLAVQKRLYYRDSRPAGTLPAQTASTGKPPLDFDY